MKMQRLRGARVWAALAAGALIVGLVAVTSAGAVPPAQTVCGTDDPFNPEFIGGQAAGPEAGVVYTTISGDVLVDGYCVIGPGAVINGNVVGGRGSGLGIGPQALVNGNVTLRGGSLYMGGPADLLPDPPPTVTGTIEVLNSVGVGLFGGSSYVFIGGAAEVGGDVTINGISSVNIQAECLVPGGCGWSAEAHIGGDLSISNVGGRPYYDTDDPDGVPGTGDERVLWLHDYTVGGSVTLTNIRDISGPGLIPGVTAGVLTDNMIAGDLSCTAVRDLDGWTVEANTVGGTDSCSG